MNTVFRPGTQIPIVGLTATPPVESRYDTVVVTNEYDFWGDFPDRPWNLVALANAVMGAAFVHTRVSFSPSDVPLSNISTTTNSLGATVTTYLVPTQHLPLTEALRIVGVPAKIVDTIDNVLRPIIDAGYSRNDAPGSTRPYLFHGAIRTGPNPQQTPRHRAPRQWWKPLTVPLVPFPAPSLRRVACSTAVPTPGYR